MKNFQTENKKLSFFLERDVLGFSIKFLEKVLVEKCVGKFSLKLIYVLIRRIFLSFLLSPYFSYSSAEFLEEFTAFNSIHLHMIIIICILIICNY